MCVIKKSINVLRLNKLYFVERFFKFKATNRNFRKMLSNFYLKTVKLIIKTFIVMTYMLPFLFSTNKVIVNGLLLSHGKVL